MKIFKKIALIVSIFLFCAAAFLTGAYFYTQDKLTVKINGEQNVVLELGETYTELGCESYFGDINVKNVTVSGGVDTDTPGVYKITYTSSFLNKTANAIRTVRVKDSTFPVITAPEALEIPIGADITKAAFEYGATDNYDGDIKERLTVEYKEDSILLKVSDSSGNVSLSTIKVTRIPDDVPPVITLKGSKNAFVILGNDYIEEGFSATDNIDGDITLKVKADGETFFTEPGSYTISYSVTDSSDNTVTVNRSIYVYNPNQTSVNPDENARVIYLTFDDGPCIYTPKILDILDKYGVKVTFFVTNQKDDWQDYIGVAHGKGHAIGAHTYSHVYSLYSSPESYFSDLDAINEVIKAQTGNYTKLLRFPGGSSNTISKKYNKGIMTYLTSEVTNRGFVYFDWNVVSGDADSTSKKNDPDYIYNNVAGSLKSGANIVLMHDINPANITALPKIIEYGLSNGFIFLPLNESSPTAHHPVLN